MRETESGLQLYLENCKVPKYKNIIDSASKQLQSQNGWVNDTGTYALFAKGQKLTKINSNNF